MEHLAQSVILSKVSMPPTIVAVKCVKRLLNVTEDGKYSLQEAFFMYQVCALMLTPLDFFV